MNWWQSLIIGLVEGFTEYLPVSSTGHILLTQRLLGIESSAAADAFAICVQGGAIVAVLGLYFRRVREMGLGLLGRNPEGARLASGIVTAFLPAAVIGLLVEKHIKHYLFGPEYGLWPVVAAWLVGGIFILAVSFSKMGKRSRSAGLSLDSLTWKMAVGIGLAQCVAMWPGVSRSLMTIVGGVLAGLSLPAAVEFSFLLGVVTLGAATAYDALRHGQEMLAAYGPLPLFLGFFTAWLGAVVAVRWMVRFLNTHGLQVFGYYRIVLAVIVAGLLLSGLLRA